MISIDKDTNPRGGQERERSKSRERNVSTGAEECEDITMLLFFDPLRLS